MNNTFLKNDLNIKNLNFDNLMILIDFIKDDDFKLFLKDLLQLYELEIDSNTLLDRYKINKIYKRNENILNMFKSKDNFLNNLEDYITFIFYILNNIKSDEDLNQMKQNLVKIKNLNIDDIYLSMKPLEEVKLSYQPEGMITDGILSRVFYREENFYTDTIFVSECDFDNDAVNIKLVDPSYVLKGVKERAFSTVSGNNIRWSIYICNLNVSFDFPDKLDTFCKLECYQDLIYREKLRLFNKKKEEFFADLEKLYHDNTFLINLANELEIKAEFLDSEIIDFFSSIDLSIVKFVKSKKMRK